MGAVLLQASRQASSHSRPGVAGSGELGVWLQEHEQLMRCELG
jgi:hypothetical protein